MPRLDFALLSFELSLESIEKLVLLQEDLESPLQELEADVRWTAPTVIQVPLKYFGALDGALWGRVCESIAHVSTSLVPFKIALKGLEAYPSSNTPRLLQTRMHVGSDLAEGLHKVLELHLDRIGISPDPRPFLTGAIIGQVSTPKGTVDLSTLTERYAETELGESYVRDLVLLKGQLKSDYSDWEVYRRFPLGAR